MTTLIRNRQLNSNSILFLDEPETALHPETTRELVEMLMLMAKSGMQIFVSTHNYFVLKQMHLIASREAMRTNCYMLNREKGQAITHKLYFLECEFPENDISEEAIKMSEEEVKIDLGL